jgi:hypothetical protein
MPASRARTRARAWSAVLFSVQVRSAAGRVAEILFAVVACDRAVAMAQRMIVVA